MKKFFSKENKFTSFFRNVADLMILNVLTLICSLPIITIGASFTAMHYVLTKWDDDKSIARDYFSAWKNNFRQATIMWVIYLIAFGIILFDFYLMKEFLLGTNAVYTYVMIAIAIILAFALTWTFILQSRYENTILQTIRNSIILGVTQLKYTVGIVALYILPFVIVYFIPHAIPVFFLLGIATAGFFQRKLYRKVFDKIENQNEDDEQNHKQGEYL